MYLKEDEAEEREMKLLDQISISSSSQFDLLLKRRSKIE